MAINKKKGTSYFRCVGSKNQCTYCNGVVIRYGYTKGGNQRVKCTFCHKTRVKNYKYNAYEKSINQQIITLTKEGLGIRSTARVLAISSTTLLARLLKIAEKISPPAICKNKTYEVDELCSFVRNKGNSIWIVYALERASKKISNFAIGKRTKKILHIVIKTLLNSQATKVYTDGFKQYKTLIPKRIHKVVRYGTNHIERFNLSIRTHLKRLSRRSICFSKNIKYLKAILKIYFWSDFYRNLKTVYS